MLVMLPYGFATGNVGRMVDGGSIEEEEEKKENDRDEKRRICDSSKLFP